MSKFRGKLGILVANNFGRIVVEYDNFLCQRGGLYQLGGKSLYWDYMGHSSELIYHLKYEISSPIALGGLVTKLMLILFGW